eukprot:TRINITY_DN253_c0_g1_i1.p1 TRINITY_DN253_c0_g1~~TRINITY_DN253_c0_g1_i1.p1  ORF type:complete len:254 (+),score=90.96 TRINITY_DN253_c0_g1_i1:59-820(+)
MSQTINDYVKLATGTSGSTLVALIKKALSEKAIFVYGELLSLDNVKNLEKGSAEEKKIFEQLQLFAYGDYQDFKNGGESKYGALNPTQTKKLKMLTVAAFGAKSSEITYDRIQKALDLNNVRELEDLILDSIYEGLIFAKLDQSEKIVQIDFAIGRDVKIDQIKEMQIVLQTWLKKSEELIQTIEDKVKYAQGEWKMNILRKDEFEKQLDERKHQLQLLLSSELEEGGGGRRKKGGRMGLGMLMGGLMRGFRN